MNLPIFSRRELLSQAGFGCGAIALGSLLNPETGNANSVVFDPSNPMRSRPSHFPGVRSVIWVVMNGGSSHIDTWDYKPELQKRDGQKLDGADAYTGFFKTSGKLMASPFRFKQHGQSGTWASEIFPHLSKHVDEMAFVHSCYSRSNNHSPALFEMNTGMNRMGFPCVGSWVTYGLGSENENLPAFVVMTDAQGRGLPKNKAQNWGSGFLPGVFQGTRVKEKGAPVENLLRLPHMTKERQRALLNAANKLNREHQKKFESQADLDARIESLELAFRMQISAPDVMSVASESQQTQAMYGMEHPKAKHFGKQCLMARKLVESGVRFIQIYSGGIDNGNSWDGHHNIKENHGRFALEIDQGVAALITDLKRRGLLESTLIVCGGEFGRTSDSQGDGRGRDHNPNAFTWWFAGGGVKGGTHFGKTDEFGYKAIENRKHIHDLHATILHLCGMKHEDLTYRFNGRDFRLTDVEGKVIKEILV